MTNCADVDILWYNQSEIYWAGKHIEWIQPVTLFHIWSKLIVQSYSIQITSLTEELHPQTLVNSAYKMEENGEKIEDWIPLYTELPSGVHKIAIDALRSDLNSSGLAVDDVHIDLCFNQCKWYSM